MKPRSPSRFGSVVEHWPINKEVIVGFPVRAHAQLQEQSPEESVQEAAEQ